MGGATRDTTTNNDTSYVYNCYVLNLVPVLMPVLTARTMARTDTCCEHGFRILIATIIHVHVVLECRYYLLR